jgi:anti-anti-sigma regulatory factor
VVAVLEVRCRIDHGAILLELEGHVGPSTAALLESCLDGVLDIDAVSVIVDLTDVDAFAEAGIAVLAEMRARCVASGLGFQLRSERSTPSAVLERIDGGGSAPARRVVSL